MALIDVGGQRGNPTLSDWFERWHIDSWTLSLLLILSGFGMVMLYSASGHDLGAVSAQAKRLGLGFVLMILVAQAPPEWYRSGAGWLYGGTVLMLVLVLLLGDSAKGAQRWLDLLSALPALRCASIHPPVGTQDRAGHADGMSLHRYCLRPYLPGGHRLCALHLRRQLLASRPRSPRLPARPGYARTPSRPRRKRRRTDLLRQEIRHRLKSASADPRRHVHPQEIAE